MGIRRTTEEKSIADNFEGNAPISGPITPSSTADLNNVSKAQPQNLKEADDNSPVTGGFTAPVAMRQGGDYEEKGQGQREAQKKEQRKIRRRYQL